MNYKVSLFYNYYTFGDVLMALIDKDAFPTHHYRDNDIVFIYSNEKLIGVNFFNLSSICKVKSNGIIHRPPHILLEVLNSLIPSKYDITLEVETDSLIYVSKINEITRKDDGYSLLCDIGKIVKIKYKGDKEPLLNSNVIIALNNAVLSNGDRVFLNDYDGVICSSKDIGENETDDIVYVDANAKIGIDFFQMKGGN